MKWLNRYIWWAVIAAATFAAGNELYGFARAGDPIDWSLLRLFFVIVVIQGVVLTCRHPGKVGKASKKAFRVLVRILRAVVSGVAWLLAKARTAVRNRSDDQGVRDELQ